MLMATSYDDNDWTMTDLSSHYKTIVKYMKWKDTGIILATDCGTRSDIESSTSLSKGKEHLGKGIF
jgi:hypothetical protein